MEAADAGVAMVRLIGADALEAAASLKRIKREEQYERSSLEALAQPFPTGKEQPLQRACMLPCGYAKGIVILCWNALLGEELGFWQPEMCFVLYLQKSAL